MFLPALVGLFWHQRPMGRALGVIGSVLFMWVLLLTVSRGAFLGICGGTILATFLFRRMLNLRLLLRISAIGIVALILIWPLLGQNFTDLIIERTIQAGEHQNLDRLSSGRLWIWGQALELQLSNPSTLVTGFGWDTFKRMNPLASHNTFLTYFFELGAIGLFLYLVLLVNVVGVMRRAAENAASDSQERAVLIGFVAGFLSLCIAVSLVNLAQAWLFIWGYVGLMLRIAVANSEEKRRGNDVAPVTGFLASRSGPRNIPPK
jgi:O-antigen ligase